MNEESFYTCDAIFLSSQKFERLVGPPDEIVTVSVHKYNVILPRPNDVVTCYHDVGCFIGFSRLVY